MRNVKEVKKGDYIVNRGEPYRVLKKEIIAVGTHSHTKVKITAQNVFSGVVEDLTFVPHANVKDIEIIRKKGQIVSNTAENLQVMDLVTYETLNAIAKEEIVSQLNEGDEITFVEFNGSAVVVDKR